MTDPPDRIASGVGGTGTGTILVGAGLGVGPETAVGKIMLLLSPVTSVIAGACLYYAHTRMWRWIEDKEAVRARADLREALDDPNVPPEDKEEFKRLLSGYYRDRIQRQLGRVRKAGDSGPSTPGESHQEETEEGQATKR